MLDPLRQELSGAGRRVGRRAGASLLVVAVLALGIGASTAVYSLLQAVLLRPLPFADAGRVVRVETRVGGEAGRLSMREVEELRQQIDAFADVAAYVPGFAYTLNAGPVPEELPAICTTRNLYDLLGVSLLYGETWPESFDHGRNFAMVLSYGAFERHFGGDPTVVGSRVSLDGAPGYTIFGVLPPGIDIPARTDLYRSIFINDFFPNYEDRERRIVVALARLAEGVPLASARAELEAFGRRLAADFPDSYEGVKLELRTLRESYVGGVRPYVLLLVAAVGLLLAIACANAAQLLLAHTLAREHEVALRRVLGASRGRMALHLLSDSLILSLGGGLVGAALAVLLLRSLASLVRLDLPSWMVIEVDREALLFALLLSLAAAVAAGAVPMLRRVGAESIRGMRGPVAGAAPGRRIDPRAALVVAAVALSLVLLLGTGLMTRSLLALLRSEAGFDADDRLTFRVALTWYDYRDDDRVRAFHRQTLERLASLPGVESAALNSNLPLSQPENEERGTVVAEGQPRELQQENPFVNLQRVSPGYLETMGIPLLRGRALAVSDGAQSEPVAMISRRLAETLWPRAEPLGQRLRAIGEQAPWRRVVGVVGDVKHRALGEEGGFDVYVPAPQPRPPDQFYVVLRSSRRDRAALLAEATDVIWSVDPAQAVFEGATMQERLLETVWRERVAGTLLALFAGIALVLASSGVYGILSARSRERTPELGVRMALGAGPGDIVREVLARALALAALGLGLGLAAALVLVRLLRSLLYSIVPFDPLTFTTLPLLLVLVAALAALLPALRAARTDPSVALRYE